jgi:dienelactone hydrolase
VKIVVWLLSVFVVSATAVSALAKPLIPLDPVERQTRTDGLQHSPWNGKSANKSISKEDGCDMRTETISVDDPVAHTTRNYDILLQSPPSKTKLPVVIIVPTIRGTQEYLEPQVARSLCHSGYASIIADVNDLRPTSAWPAWGGEDINNRRAILALKTVYDYATRVPRFDADRIGAMGLSLGGITTALWAGVDPRLKATVVVVGGGNLPYILSHSDEPNVASMRDKRMKAAGLRTIDEYDQALRGNVTLDPFYFAPQANKHRILQILAESDTKVPYSVQREMYQAWGGPQSITFTTGHVFTIIQVVYFYMGDVVDFFNDRMKPGASLLDFKPITHKRIVVEDRPD